MRTVELKQRHWGGTVCCVLVYLLALRLAHPVLEAPFSDDFSYIFTAKRAAETGRLIYNGWACPMLGIQVYLAALFIRVFGFSFTVARAAVMLLQALNIAVLHRTFLSLSPRNTNAVLAAVSLAVAPIAFPHSVLFFTDLPGQFAFVVALYCCIQAMQAEDDPSTRRWLIWCVVLNLVLGTVRQTAWLGSLVLLPAVVWRLRHRAGVFKLGVALWAVSIVTVGGCVYWLSHAPYAPKEDLFLHLGRGWLVMLPTLPVFAMFELLPLLLSMLGLRSIVRERRTMTLASFVAALSALYFATLGRPIALFLASVLVRYPIPYKLPFGVAAASFLFFLAALALQAFYRSFREEEQQPSSNVNVRDLALVLAPYLLITASLVFTREGMWPRYVLPLTPALAVLLYRMHAERSKLGPLPFVTAAATVVCAAFATAAAHDDMLFLTPTLRLQRDYLAMGLPRNQLETGVSLDGWYELSTGHTINEPRIRIPANAYHPRDLTAQQRRCHTFFLPYSPDIHPVYGIANGPSECVQGLPLATETQTFWMTPSMTQYLYKFAPSQQMP